MKTTAEDLADLSGWLVERVLASLHVLAPHILIDDLALFAEGDLEIGLAPLLHQDGADCGDLLTRYWTAHYVMRMAPKLKAAEQTVAEGLARAKDLVGAGERVTGLLVHWDAYRAQRDGLLPIRWPAPAQTWPPSQMMSRPSRPRMTQWLA